jgi:hypothetical protein
MATARAAAAAAGAGKSIHLLYADVSALTTTSVAPAETICHWLPAGPWPPCSCPLAADSAAVSYAAPAKALTTYSSLNAKRRH